MSDLKYSNEIKRRRLRELGLALLLVVAGVGVSGCHTWRFYGQAIKGQYRILAHEQPIDKLMTQPETPQKLKSRFELLDELRAFAQSDLKLPLDGHYRKYVDLHRPYVVWNVEAAPEFSMQAKTWWYPMVGSLEYRGYFSKPGATNYARYLRKKGYDVEVGGVTAYSTLGWFKDPVLNTFIFDPDAELAETIFHELGHARVFAHGDTDFNEAFATTVGEEGARRWLATCGKSGELEGYKAHLQRNMEFVHLVLNARARLESLYEDQHTEDGKVKTAKKRDLTPQQLRRQKESILNDLKKEFAALRAQWGGNDEFDWWFEGNLNNARLNSIAAYYDFVPGFEQLLAQNDGELGKFYQAAKALSKLPKDQRHARLQALARARLEANRAMAANAAGPDAAN